MTSNVNLLIIHKMSCDAIPKSGGVADAIGFLANKDAIMETTRRATQWVKDVIALVKTAPDNPYGDDDEAIAGAILKKLTEKKQEALK